MEIAEEMHPPVTNGDDRHLDREQAQKNEQVRGRIWAPVGFGAASPAGVGASAPFPAVPGAFMTAEPLPDRVTYAPRPMA